MWLLKCVSLQIFSPSFFYLLFLLDIAFFTYAQVHVCDIVFMQIFGLCSEQIASMHHATCERKRVLWLSCCKWCTDMKKVLHLRLEKGSVNGNCCCWNAFAKLFNFFFDIEIFFCRSLFLSHSRFSLEIWLSLCVLLLLCCCYYMFRVLAHELQFRVSWHWRCDENEKKKSH